MSAVAKAVRVAEAVREAYAGSCWAMRVSIVIKNSMALMRCCGGMPYFCRNAYPANIPWMDGGAALLRCFGEMPYS